MIEVKSSRVTRQIIERRNAVYEIEPRTFEGAPGMSNFYADGVKVGRTIRSYGEPGNTLVEITGYSVTKSGKRSAARGALEGLPVDLVSDFSAGHYGLKWHIHTKHFEEIRELAQKAVDDFHFIDWQTVVPS